ncbi:hypothetical protein CLU79DRAFT_406113 [Phycomyces nitens]|nr:hypothetical protein CLU79DRAFT_406113 [Phycomyces nitens]
MLCTCCKDQLVFPGAPILSAAFLLFGRKAIAAESYWMMTTFIAYQLSIVSLNIVMLVWAVQFMIYDIWYFLCAYAGTSVITCLITIFVSIRCLLNFGKGLHPHVQFGWYKLKKDHTVLGARTNSNHIAENMSLDAWAKEEDMYIDPDSSLIASDYGIDEEPNLGYRNRGF